MLHDAVVLLFYLMIISRNNDTVYNSVAPSGLDCNGPIIAIIMPPFQGWGEMNMYFYNSYAPTGLFGYRHL
jgi:hypothetical protein